MRALGFTFLIVTGLMLLWSFARYQDIGHTDFYPQGMDIIVYVISFILGITGLICAAASSSPEPSTPVPQEPKKEEPPVVKVAAPLPLTEEAIAEKITKLKKLKEDGILTEQEYQEKRRELIKQL